MAYLGLILFWVSPVLLFQWLLTFDYLTALPWKVTALPICIPTLYLWVADASAVRAGTWVIEKGTKLDYQIWDGLEIEEAVFFFLTNVMVVGGLIGCDYAFGIEELRRLCAKTDVQKKDIFLKDALLGIFKALPGTDTAAKDELARAVKRLQAKSESMFLGSALFHGNLRIDLIFLYSFCRVVDDLVDDSGYDKEQARYWIRNCSIALNNRFKNDQTTGGAKFNDPTMALKYNELQSSVDHLPVSRLSREPLHDLLKGFEMDLEFDYTKGCFPIRDEVDLDLYASRVASTIAALILDLVYYYYYHNKPIHPPDHLEHVTKAGKEMGKALQLVNIARDIRRDAAIGRVYIPTSWLRETGLTPIDVIHRPTSAEVYRLQERLLEKANICYTAARDTIEELPHSVRGPIRATVDSYMEIGRILREKKGKNLQGAKLSVPLWRRLLVAWSAMLQKKY
ncbi:Squalene/phytoene synthase-domain-containing protein [Aspergillus alliaceus]|uniref:Bifunctional lycopene cyclase/phytoene synthase n=1 Tax=Petromyces alliaceus TaxID=209559 RepID=A0A5N7BU56_PETAA|nr:Squalene/phytoene synthase-domain-containing protein [Aspergillus alliaceus]